jgi:hypothetical protein
MTEAYLSYAFSGFWPFCGAFLLAVLGASLAAYPFRIVFLVWNRLMRHLNIRARGWPPPHLDADGDWKTGAS